MKNGGEPTQKPELLNIRFVCGACLRVMHAPLDIIWNWDKSKIQAAENSKWVPIEVRSPICHGAEMLILGEPKLDVFGLRSRGIMLDPLDAMRCPIVQAPK